MKRKIVKHGNATLTISLPSEWIRKHGLKKGDEITLSEQEKGLFLSPVREVVSKRIILNIDDIDPPYMLSWILAGLYKKFDEIELRYSKSTPGYISKYIYEALESGYVGFTIIEQTDKVCVLKAIVKEEPEEFDATLKRIFLVLKLFAGNTLEYTKKGDMAKLEELIYLERTMNKLTNFCERILIKKGYSEYEKTCLMYLLVWNFEKVSEYYYYIGQYLMENKKVRLSKDLLNLFAKTNDVLETLYDVFYNFDLKKVVILNKKQKIIVAESKELIKKLSPQERMVLCYLQEIATKLNLTGTLTALNYKVD